MLASVTVFSLAMVLCAIAPGVTLFGIGRVLVGFGVGGVVPSITALVFEYSAPQRRNVNTAVALAGIGMGARLRRWWLRRWYRRSGSARSSWWAAWLRW